MPSINGHQPDIDGAILQGMICTQHWPNGTCEDAANVIYFRVHDRWHRLYFDFGTVFWRSDVDAVPDYPDAPTFTDPEPGTETFFNNDLGSWLNIIGHTISTCITESVGDHDSKVTFNFIGGGLVRFTCIGDITSVEHSGLRNRGT